MVTVSSRVPIGDRVRSVSNTRAAWQVLASEADQVAEVAPAALKDAAATQELRQRMVELRNAMTDNYFDRHLITPTSDRGWFPCKSLGSDYTVRVACSQVLDGLGKSAPARAVSPQLPLDHPSAAAAPPATPTSAMSAKLQESLDRLRQIAHERCQVPESESFYNMSADAISASHKKGTFAQVLQGGRFLFEDNRPKFKQEAEHQLSARIETLQAQSTASLSQRKKAIRNAALSGVGVAVGASLGGWGIPAALVCAAVGVTNLYKAHGFGDVARGAERSAQEFQKVLSEVSALPLKPQPIS